MEENQDSVFDLLTSLCEKYSDDQKVVKKLRSKCYEAFLGKRVLKDPRKFDDLKDTSDPSTCILSWCFRLSHEFEQRESSLKLMNCLEDFKSNYGDKNAVDSILRFLYVYRDLPLVNEDTLDLSVLPKIDEMPMQNFQNMFKLPASLLLESEQYTSCFNSKSKLKIKLTDSDFTIHNIPKSQSTFSVSERSTIVQQNIPRSQSAFTILEGFPQMKVDDICNKNLDEGYGSLTKDLILEKASEAFYSDRKCWENLGYLEPAKEKPFLSELGELTSLWVENLESLYLKDNFCDFGSISVRIKPRKEVLKDLKFLLIGMPSDTFPINPQHVFYLMPGTMVETVSPDTLEQYCQKFLFCGACYRGLLLMSTPDPKTRKYKHPGYVFTEFCTSLSRYLQFYRTAVMSISDSTNFFEFDERTHQIRRQISLLASICRVGPFISQTEDMPHGVALLNYLYLQVLGLSDSNLCMVLYSILYPCCQVYFSNFLHQWIFKGSIHDPYGEFFIIANTKYVSTRGRTYWTRSFETREDIVPDFLVDLKDEILFCGKMMNLLELCSPNNKLCAHLRGKISVMPNCCLNSNQLSELEKNASRYFLEASAECGPKFDLSELFNREKLRDANLTNLMAKKRAATLRRIELERQKDSQEKYDKKMEELQMLREQYESALEQKEIRICKEIIKEIKNAEEILDIEKIREKLIAEEATEMIKFYSKLWEVADSRRKKVYQYLISVKHLNIDTNIEREHTYVKENAKDIANHSSNESFYSVPDNIEETADKVKHVLESEVIVNENVNNAKDDLSNEVKQDVDPEDTPRPIHTSESLDLINANTKSDCLGNPTLEDNKKLQNNINYQQAMDNFEAARKNKLKVLNQDFDIIAGDSKTIDTSNDDNQKKNVATLSAAQRNKLRVLSSEFGIDVINKNLNVDNILTIAQINRNKVLGTNECFTGNYVEKHLDNAAFLNNKNPSKHKTDFKKSKSLMLDLPPSSKTFDKAVPMSVDSTPMSELTQSVSEVPPSVTPSTTYMSLDTRFDSLPSTSSTQMTNSNLFNSAFRSQNDESSRKMPVFSKRVTVEEAACITNNCLKLFLHESVSIPIFTQRKLVNNEILRYFIQELSYLKHLASLRDYFFLQDGEFGRNITEKLFEKLYQANFPLELINARTLQHLVFDAMDSSSKYHENSQSLSFRINSLPKCFDLGNPDVLECLSLTYKVNWPLNILLPSDAVAKYDQVFKYLVKLNRVSWVLKNIFLEMKVLAKETGKKEIYLMSSPQYRKLHQSRHVMHHFINTLQNYIVGEVLQPSWKIFEESMSEASTLNDLYNAHTVYIKDILFRCHLNQKTTPLRNIIQRIFSVVLKFFDYLRSRRWICEDGQYVHPNFSKLDKIFDNFKELVVYLFKVIRKITKKSYQPHLLQFLDVLDVNNYYSRQVREKNASEESH